MKKQMSIVALAASTALLLGCSSGTPADSSLQNESPATSEMPDPQEQSTTPSGLSIDHIKSCADAEAAMGPYIEGLVQMEGNIVDEWGVSCTWTMAEGETDWANAREVSLGIVPLEGGEAKPDVEGLQEFLPGTTEISSDWVAAQGGVAFESRIGTDTIGAITSTVWTPEFELSIGGGAWEGFQTLDGNAAVQVAQQLLK